MSRFNEAGEQPAILVEGLTKSFGEVHALRGIDLSVPRGTVLGLLGPNGAGKTTAVRILTTLLLPDQGRAVVEGHDVVREAAAVRRSIGLAGQSAAIQEELTGRENLEIIGRLYHLSRPETRSRATALLEQFGYALFSTMLPSSAEKDFANAATPSPSSRSQIASRSIPSAASSRSCDSASARAALSSPPGATFP